MLVRVLTSTLVGIDAIPVEVETDISQGLPSCTVVGLAAGPVRESVDRIRAAVRNSGFPFSGRKITINLAPADVRKDGALLDLPIALSILCAEGVIPDDALGRYLVAGELSLDGTVKPVRGILSQALLASNLGLAGIIVPVANAREAALVPRLSVLPVADLRSAAGILSGEAAAPLLAPDDDGEAWRGDIDPPDLSDVAGQPVARRALEIAAAGGHAILFVGPPGCGKTMLAERLPGILPAFVENEALETAQIYSAAGEPPWPRVPVHRPFRSPHFSISQPGLVGGGNPPRPGEISFAHGGVLFLDEFGEFSRQAREALRQPLESGEIRIARAGASCRFPSRFLLAAATNPCPCGNAGNPRRICRCPPTLRAAYARRFSGPILDRIDLAVTLMPVPGAEWAGAPTGEVSASVKLRVAACRELQRRRYPDGGIDAGTRTNGQALLSLSGMTSGMASEARTFLIRAADKMSLSGRVLAKTCRVARTIADLSCERTVALPHLAEALQYRLPGLSGEDEN